MTKVDFVVAKSYEERALAVLDHMKRHRFDVRRVFVIGFREYEVSPAAGADPLDVEAVEMYRARSAELLAGLKSLGVKVELVELSLDEASDSMDLVAEAARGSRSLALDISCLPRLHLSAATSVLMNEVSRCEARLVYTRPAAHLPEERRFSVGVRGFACAPGLAGAIRHQPSVAIMALGFEASRAYATLRHLQPESVVALIGHSGDNLQDFYVETVRSNNAELLARRRTIQIDCASLDVIPFAGQLTALARDAVMKQRNVYWVPLGTKLQAVAGVLASRACSEIQHVFALPSHRRLSTTGIGETIDLPIRDLVDRFDRAAVSQG